MAVCVCVCVCVCMRHSVHVFLDGCHLTCFAAVHVECVLLAHQGFGEAGPLTDHFLGVRCELGAAAAGQGAVGAGHLGGLGDRLHHDRGGFMQAVASRQTHT